MLERANVMATIKLVCRLTDILLMSKTKCLQRSSEDSDIYRNAHNLVLMSYNIILGCMRHSFRMYRLLANGLLTSMLYTDLRYFHFDRLNSTPETKVTFLSVQIVNEISTFLVYPVLLRRFIRSRRTISPNRTQIGKLRLSMLFIETSKSEARCALTLCVLLSKRLLKNAKKHVIKDVWDVDRLYTVDRSAAPQIGRKSIANNVRKYTRTKKVSTMCVLFNDGIVYFLLDGLSPLMRDEIRFFAYLLEDYLRRFAGNISHRISSASESIRGYAIQDLFFPVGLKMPILFVDFDSPDLPQETAARLLNQETLNEWIRTKYFCESQWLSSIFPKWQETGPFEIFVLAAFPRAQGIAWPYIAVVDFPLKEDLRFNFDISNASAP
ncbi:hypothetical protein V5O48_003019 [Marasmius crinis-equi]|uniref:Uncharacterized protein n=1 Tax=Marasmius crinis-equi TaxID=585013 RepID=A0ABR3FU20_9AGAR